MADQWFLEKRVGTHISQESLKQSVHGNVAEWVQGMQTREGLIQKELITEHLFVP